ncbi:MAG TPA: hypothetical protein VK049_01630 [Paenalcaligenes sp.]|nr:hypothetical protein [Paenalcaligenes sp.]
MEQPTHQPNPNTPEPAQPVTAAALEQGISQEKINSLRTITIIVYVLQALTYFTAITGIIGLIINYVKRGDAQNTWLASHFRWQIRTFWFGLLWSLIGLVLVYFFVGLIVLLVVGIWVIYRIVRGVLAAIDRKPMYQ